MRKEIIDLIKKYKPLPIRDPAGKHVRKLDEAQKLLDKIYEIVQSSEDQEDV